MSRPHDDAVVPDTDRGDDVDEAAAPLVSGDDVRPGPEMTDEPAAGMTEPSD